MWGVPAVSSPHWVCPHWWCVCFHGLYFSGSRLLCQELSGAGPVLRALSRSKPLRFRVLSTPRKRRLHWTWVLCPSQVWAAHLTRRFASAFTSRWAVRLIFFPIPVIGFLGVQRAHLLRCAMCLFWWADLWLQSSRQMSTIQNRKNSRLAMQPACCLVEDTSLGQRLPVSGSGCPTPHPRLLVSGGGWSSPQPVSSPLVFAQSFVLWVGLAVPQVRAVHGIVVSLSLSLFFFLSLSLSGYPTVWVAISSQFPQIAFRAFGPSPYPKQCSLGLPVQPPLAGGSCKCWELPLGM